LLEEHTKGMTPPMSELISKEYGKDPYLILISCLLSLRARDTVTYPISKELFTYARTPQEMVDLPQQTIAGIIRSIGYYNRKAQILQEVSMQLLQEYNGRVPKTEKELLSLKGVGRKTANLVLSVAFDIPAICVDVHVHQVANRLGIIQTKTTEETEIALQKLVPRDRWISINRLFVQWGQNICVPVSPKCSQCVLSPLCPKIGVTKFR
jgi:endonuclease-3